MSLSPEITARLEAARMHRSAILTDASEAWERGEFVEATLDRWLTKQKSDKPHCFIDEKQADLELSAFSHGNMSARGRLVALHGEGFATERAQAWGLKSLHDTRTKGKSPFGKADANAGLQKGQTNPWSAEGWNITKQGAIVKALGEAKAAQIAKAANSHLGATRPTRAA